MTDSWMILFFLALVGAGYFFWQWREAQKQLSAHASQIAETKVRLEQIDAVTAERDTLRGEVNALGVKLATEQADAKARLAAAAEKEQALLAMKADVEKTFETLASRALGQSEQRFLNLANETFEKHKTAAASGVNEILAPVRETFAKLSGSVEALDKARTEDKSALSEQMRSVTELMAKSQLETGKLVNALRAAPKTRGRWGEETLKNVLELSGLSAHADFSEQSTHQDDDGRMMRPDVIIRLPGGRSIIVDAKVALSGYLDAMDAPDEMAREAFLKKHASELRAHVKALSSKDYSKFVGESADFVALFIPGENFFAAAVERDPNLFEDAMKMRVIIVTPVTMMALARSIAYGWRQEQAAQNAEEISRLGRELYSRLATMGDHIGKVGDAIGKSVSTYNQFIGSLESRVMPAARKFKDLGAGDAGVEIAIAQHLESAPRLPAPQGELDLPPALPRAKRN